MEVALYEPDIAQNTAAILRTAACFATPVHIVGPAGFDLSARAVRRAGLDYAARVPLTRHHTFADLCASARGRIILFTTAGATHVTTFPFRGDDILLFGRESAGVPQAVHEACAHRVRIPIAPGARSLNLAVAVGIGLMTALAASGSIGDKGLT